VLVGYEVIITNSALHTLWPVIYHLIINLTDNYNCCYISFFGLAQVNLSVQLYVPYIGEINNDWHHTQVTL